MSPRIHEPFRDSSTVEQAAVNRKVQGSNPCPGANFEFEIDLSVEQQLTAVQQTYSNALSSSPFVTLGGSLLPKSCRQEPAQVSVMTLSITVIAGFAATVPRPTKVPTIRTLAR